MPKYRKKPVVIEAVVWTGKNIDEMRRFIPESANVQQSLPHGSCLLIPTLEGQMTAQVGDYIIKGIKGEFYPCKPDIFEETYDEVNNDPYQSSL